ncbi:MAG TPA: hypothetical protein VHX52_12075 [Steroidobacteraceae bacterium]|jgi:hypothetical protein|nr:hypothetical protein [Steroidobacteraceae bacterium]
MRIHLVSAGVATAFAALALCVTGIVPRQANAASAASCDRACLEGFVDQYLDALLAHDPARLPVTKDVKFTENGQRLELGDGLWRTMTGKGTYRMLIADTAAGRVAFLGSIREAGTPAMLALHLAVRNHRIVQIETLVQRSDKSALGFEKLGYPWTSTIAPGERMSRTDLVRIANMYFSGMQQNDGKGVYPFAKDCNRIENGTFTTNVPTPPGHTRPDPQSANMYSAQWSCMEQFKSGLLHFVTRIRDRRFVAVDPERGLVFSFVFFDHSAGNTRTFQTPDGRTVTAGPVQPWTWELAETFQIEYGKIHQIMAIMNHVQYGMNSGWSTWDQGRSSRARYLGQTY